MGNWWVFAPLVVWVLLGFISEEAAVWFLMALLAAGALFVLSIP